MGPDVDSQKDIKKEATSDKQKHLLIKKLSKSGLNLSLSLLRIIRPVKAGFGWMWQITESGQIELCWIAAIRRHYMQSNADRQL